MAYTVSQNASLYTAASVLQKAVSFVYFTIVARLIGVEDTGQYFFAISFAVVFTVIADFGLAAVLTRETARYPEKTEEYITTVFWTKILFGLLSYGLMIGSSYLLGYDVILKKLIMVAGLTMFFDNLHNVFFGVFRAHRNLLYESIGIVLSQTITMIIGLTALFNNWQLWWLIAAYTVASIVTTIFAAFSVHRVFHVRFRFAFNKAIFTSFLAIAVPFGVAGILMRFYSYADSIIMSKMLDPEHLGWWSVPYKMTFAFQFIPVAISASIYPVMSSFMVTDKSRIPVLFEKSWRYLLLISLPLAFGLAAVAEPLIVKVYTASYLPSVPVLRILLISLVFGYLSFVTGSTLNATNNQKKQTILLASTLVCNVLLNLLLIPMFGLKGAAVAALVGNVMLCVGGYMLVSNTITINLVGLMVYALKVGIPAALMGLVAYYLAETTSLFVAIPVGVVVFGVLVMMTGAVSGAMLVEFKQKLFHKKAV